MDARRVGYDFRSLRQRAARAASRAISQACAYFSQRAPTFSAAFTPFLLLAAILYVRSPFSNYIFDEQEALLANPYVNGRQGGLLQAFYRDFWGLGPERSIGSYRPLPNLVWRLIWLVHEHPWVHHTVNVLVHAVNAALVAKLTWRWTNQRNTGWLAGLVFASFALLTETVSGVVGLADVLSGFGLLLALLGLALPVWLSGLTVFAAVSLALFSKESSLVAVAVLPLAALLGARGLHPERPLRVLRTAVVFFASALALVFYTEVRRRCFPTSAATAPDWSSDEALAQRLFEQFLYWFQQPRLPQDPINNPLIGIAFGERVKTALSIYADGLGQLFFPRTLSGDYSFAEELPRTERYPLSTLLGATLLIGPVLLGLVFGVVSLCRRARPNSFDGSRPGPLALTALALMWLPLSYFPHSNIPILLPTVRADRFWYLPAIAAAWLAALLFARLAQVKLKFGAWQSVYFCLFVFLGVQCIQARRHAFDYNSDLSFWRATARSSPKSAKAHLNYGVMLGARGDLEGRLSETGQALQIAPKWPMASIYYGDTLCRLRKPDAALPYYVTGFELAPNDPNLIALALQCLWDKQAFKPHQDELSALAAQHPGSWLSFLIYEVLDNGERNGGVDKKYRPRGYDESAQ